MIDLLNCPNCGAPITSEKCEYCGSVFLDFAAIQVGAPSYVKFKVGDAYIIAKLVVTTLDINTSYDTTDYVDTLGSIIASAISGCRCDFHMDAHAVCSSEGSLLTIIKEVESEQR